jgi:hypothetical protein
MKAWLNPDLSENEYKFELFTWWDSLADWQKTKALLSYLIKAGINIEGLIMKC